MNKRSQAGFALAVIMIVMFILMLIVVVLLRNQNLAVRETSDIFAAATRAQESHNIHRKCLQLIRAKMTETSLNNTIQIDLSAPFSISTGSCQVEASMTEHDMEWAPHLRITSQTSSKIEITEWRYEACLASTPDLNCLISEAQLMVKEIRTGEKRIIKPKFIKNVPIHAAWRQQ